MEIKKHEILNFLCLRALLLVVFCILIKICILAQVGNENLLEKELEEKEAVIWYLGHSGWAIKTKNHLLVFDYVEREANPAEPCLSNGYINPTEIKDQHSLVFVSHWHSDHYSQEIFDWEKSIKDINYILGWQGVTEPKSIRIGPRERRKIDEVEVLTIASTDEGVGFLVKVDGLVIFHGGDHAYWGGPMDSFEREMDYLIESDKEFDIVFLAVATGSGQRRESISQGIFYAVEKLLPKVIFPMHAGGNEGLYKEFAAEAEKRRLKTKVLCAGSKGDGFFYQKGKID